MTYITVPGHARSKRLSLTHLMTRRFDLWRQRRALTRLDAAALRDIGLTRSEAETEARRPIWDAPESWSC
ncbi:DUF1127 domain-containing protein [Sedimentitalea todarodis]|uniref:DUF1127 domain-containing protein n=1 Tax=Sedimentitalea todarodis TaxID=1631240 RepID=A0ABU3VK30_9RHOB|nr:DUF1127 domain-containing protein [Sedimentitalea todarodis]MDU9006340.1 DUF1127 domain-containing protein [Sedimentitalea todarodis]